MTVPVYLSLGCSEIPTGITAAARAPAFPLSEMVQCNVLKVTKAANNKKQFQQF